MRINCQHSPPKITRGTAYLAQRNLKVQAVGDGSGAEEFMDGHVGGEERQSVGQLKDPLVQGAAVSQSGA
jgi:hypothetical protein